jgi:hypothetical protein
VAVKEEVAARVRGWWWRTVREERWLAQEREGGISQKAIFCLISNRYNSPIFIVPNGLASQVTTGNILIDWIFLS